MKSLNLARPDPAAKKLTGLLVYVAYTYKMQTTQYVLHAVELPWAISNGSVSTDLLEWQAFYHFY